MHDECMCVCVLQVHALQALLDEYSIKLPDVDRAGYATMDSSYAALKALVEEVEANKDASISKYGAELDTGAHSLRTPMQTVQCLPVQVCTVSPRDMHTLV